MKIYIVLMSILLTGLAGCGCMHSVSLKAVLSENGQPEFIVKSSGINSIYSMHFWTNPDKGYIWAFKGIGGGYNNIKKAHIHYGQMPKKMIQIQPGDNKKPRPILPGEIVYVMIDYLYDCYVPSTSTNSYAFLVLPDGKWEILKNHKIEYMK